MTRFLFAAFLVLVGCTTTVNPGEVGVEVRWGVTQAGVRSPGMYMTVISDVNVMSVRTQTYTMAGAGAEGQANGSVNVLRGASNKS